MPGERLAEQGSEIRELASANKKHSLSNSIWHMSMRKSRKANWAEIPV